MYAGNGTGYKHAEEKLYESTQRYDSLIDEILDYSNVGIFILDKNFEIAWMNAASERYFGLRKEQVLGLDWRQLICEQIKCIFEYPEPFVETVRATYDNNTYTERFECHVLAGDRREDHWLEHWSQPIYSGLFAGGRIEEYTDITHRKRTEAEIADARRKLNELAYQVRIAEIETNTLHNVANILNSLNVSANYIRETVLNSKTKNLKDVIEMIAAYLDHFGTLFSDDERGKRLFTYLMKVAELEIDEQVNIIDQIRSFKQNLVYVNQIIQTRLESAKPD